MISSGEYISNKESIKEILYSNGYPVSESADYINTAALWRNGSDPKSVAIYYRDNLCLDFVDGSKFDIRKLVSLITNKISDDELDLFFKERNIVISPPSPKISQAKIFSDDILKELIPLNDYWLKRGISEEVLKKVKGGIYSINKGIFRNKYVFPIFNSKNQIIGLTGRDVNGNNGEYKWIIRGQKTNFCWPAFINSNIIKERGSVWLVEGIGDALSLMSCGVENVLVLFGTNLNLAIINYLLKINIKSIYISTNDDSNQDNNMAGNKAAEKIYKRLNKYFSSSQIKIVHPKGGKDWNEILVKENGKQLILEQLKEYIK